MESIRYSRWSLFCQFSPNFRALSQVVKVRIQSLLIKPGGEEWIYFSKMKANIHNKYISGLLPWLYAVWYFGKEKKHLIVIRLYLKVPKNFLRLIFLDRFWFMLGQILLLALFLVDHLFHPVMLSIHFRLVCSIRLLCNQLSHLLMN